MSALQKVLALQKATLIQSSRSVNRSTLHCALKCKFTTRPRRSRRGAYVIPRSFPAKPNWIEGGLGRYGDLRVTSAILLLLLALLIHTALGDSQKTDQK